jgi:hypothetical protein
MLNKLDAPRIMVPTIMACALVVSSNRRLNFLVRSYKAQRASSGGPTLLYSASENLAVDDVPREDLPSVPLRLPWAPSTSTATTRTPLPADGGYPERERAT